jgi:lipopolysaccharide/colanic/teichoic acid biosynthesis glycosyltransferase
VSPAAQRLKRVVDLLLVCVGGLVLLPILGLVAMVVGVVDGRPVLYRSARVGRHGQPFPLYKFRTMAVDADQRRAALRSDVDGPLFKLRDDPRVTPLGRWLRRTSVDELPQLWNVLRGDMHLVGPRPLPVEDLAGAADDPALAGWYRARHAVRPGITGPWQVAGRSDLGFLDMMRLDLAYLSAWSPVADLVLLARTLPAVVRGRGAR